MAVVDDVFETQGTHLFVVDNITSTDPYVLKMTCPTGITGIAGGSADRTDVTCLEDVDGFRHFIGGLADGDAVSVPFVLHKANASHQALFALRQSRDVVGWFVGLSDDDAAPTMDTDFDLVAPATRTGFSFRGYISNLTIDANGNDAVRGTLTIQTSGATTPHWAE